MSSQCLWWPLSGSQFKKLIVPNKIKKEVEQKEEELMRKEVVQKTTINNTNIV